MALPRPSSLPEIITAVAKLANDLDRSYGVGAAADAVPPPIPRSLELFRKVAAARRAAPAPAPVDAMEGGRRRTARRQRRTRNQKTATRRRA